MTGVTITQEKAKELIGKGFEVWMHEAAGFMVRTDNMNPATYTYSVYSTGYEQRPIPQHAMLLKKGDVA